MINSNSKKGVSPLIATVLLIAFSVALGAVVMNWGRGFISEKTDDVEKTTDVQLKCSVDILLDFLEISDTTQVCYNATGDYVEFTIENKGSANVTGLSIQVINTDNDVFTNDTNDDLESGSAQRHRISGTNMNSVQYVGVSPIISTPGSTTATQICTNNKLELSDPEVCT